MASENDTTRYKAMTDEELALDAKNGDAEAEEFLIRKYKGEINKVAGMYSIAGADKDDSVQEAMIALFRAIRSFDADGGASFRTYARVCMGRRLVSAAKAASRKKHAPLNDSVSLADSIFSKEKSGEGLTFIDVIAAQTDDPYTKAMINDVFEYINASGNVVFSPMEAAVWNGRINGSDYEEIARELGKDSKAVYNAMERTKKKILKYLDV